jgi:hypothetical protein
MPTTPFYAWPYPAGTDRVMDGDNAMGALAAAIETTVRKIGAALSATAPVTAKSNAQLVLTNAFVAIPGAVITYTPTAPETALLIGTFHFNLTTAGAQGTYGACFLNAAQRPGYAWYFPTGDLGAETVTGIWTFNVAAVANTIDLRARKAAAGGVANVENSLNSTGLTVVRFPNVVLGALAELLGEVAEPLPAEAAPAP